MIAVPKLGHAGFVDYFDKPIKAEGTEETQVAYDDASDDFIQQ